MARTPDFRLVVDGQALGPEDATAAVRPRLQSLTLTEERGGEADTLELTLSDHDGRLAIPAKGAMITLALGWKGEAGLVDKGVFRIDQRGHAGAPDALTLRARSADFSAGFRIKRDRVFRATSLGAVLARIAADGGLTAEVDPRLAAVPVSMLDQSGRSDSDLLQRLGRDHDAVATVKARRLIFAPIGKGANAAGQALPAFTIVRADGDQHNWGDDDREASFGGIEANWHDKSSAERKTVTIGAADGSAPPKRLRRVYATEAAAERAAKAEQGRVQRNAATFSLSLAYGRPELYPEQRGRVQGFKPEIDAAQWLIKSCAHALGDGGFTTALQLETA